MKFITCSSNGTHGPIILDIVFLLKIDVLLGLCYQQHEDLSPNTIRRAVTKKESHPCKTNGALCKLTTVPRVYSCGA